MNAGTKRTWTFKARRKLSKTRRYAVVNWRHNNNNNNSNNSSKTTSPITITNAYTGAFIQYPCSMTINDLSMNEVTLLPGLYITSIRDCTMQTIREILHKLQDDFWDTLRMRATRKHIIASSHTACLAFCNWASSPCNGKLVAAFCQTAPDSLTVTINEGSIECSALNLNPFVAKNLLDSMACVALASGLISPIGEERIGDACMEVTTTAINRFSVLVTLQFVPSYMERVIMDEARLNSLYGQLAAELCCS
jgi:hypothetical protein